MVLDTRSRSILVKAWSYIAEKRGLEIGKMDEGSLMALGKQAERRFWTLHHACNFFEAAIDKGLTSLPEIARNIRTVYRREKA